MNIEELIKKVSKGYQLTLGEGIELLIEYIKERKGEDIMKKFELKQNNPQEMHLFGLAMNSIVNYYNGKYGIMKVEFPEDLFRNDGKFNNKYYKV